MRNVFQLAHSWFAVLDRYLLKEFSVNLIAVTGVLWLIYVSTRFARYLAQAAAGNMPAEVILDLLGYNSLGAMAILLPVGTFLAVMLALGRMSSDSELTVMSACGVSRLRVVRNVMLFSGVVAIIVGGTSLWVVPEVLAKRYNLEQQAKLSADTTGLIAGSFKESRNGDWTFYSEGLSADKKRLENVFIEIHGRQRPLIFRSKGGYFEIDSKTGDKFLILTDGYRYQGEAGDQDFTIAQFATHSLLVEKGGQQVTREKLQAMPTKDLLESGRAVDIAEVQWRASSALMTLILSLLAIPLANAKPRQGRYAGFVPAVFIYLIYSNLLGVSKAWVAKEKVMPWLGGSLVHIVMLLVLIILFNRRSIEQWLRSIRTKTQP